MENVPNMPFCIKYIAEKFKLWNLCSPAFKLPSQYCAPEGLVMPRGKQLGKRKQQEVRCEFGVTLRCIEYIWNTKISKTKNEVSYCCSYQMWQVSVKLRQAWQSCCNSSKVRLVGQWPGWPAGKTQEMASSWSSPCLLQLHSTNRHLYINNFHWNTFWEISVLQKSTTLHALKTLT